MINIAIFASGSGTNAENIVNYFKNSKNIKVKAILTNNPHAGVIERAKRLNIEIVIFNREQINKTDFVVNVLKNNQIDYIVLAGYLWLIPKNILELYPDKIINVHPALLPAHGGKGMYGDKVHKAVIECGDKVSGITIHNVNEFYDEGQIIFQAKCPVNQSDTPESLAKKVHALEYEYFPVMIEKTISNLII